MKKSDTKTVKSNNTSLIFGCLLGGPLSRADIVKKTGLSKATVTSIINELLESGRLYEIGKEVSDSAGRPAIYLDINKNYCYAAGFSLHRSRLSVCITNLSAELIDHYTVNTKDFSDPKAATDFLFSKLLELAEKNGISVKKIIGIGISAPGPLDYKRGIIHKPGNLELFFDFNIVDYLSEKTELPIYLDNNSVLLCLLDSQLRKSDLKDYMFIVMSEGVGSVTVADNQIFRGSYGYSGELGHTSVEPEGLSCSCGNKGCLEKYITMSALKSRFGFDSYESIVDKFIAGEKSYEEILDFIADKLSFALINSINLTDPAAIIIYGEFNYNHRFLFDKIKEKVYSRSTVAGLHKIDILPSVLSNEANITATTTAIIKAYFEQRLW